MVKILFGSIGDSFSVGSLKAYLAEFIATLLFVFAGVGSAIAYSKYYGSFHKSLIEFFINARFVFLVCIYNAIFERKVLVCVVV